MTPAAQDPPASAGRLLGLGVRAAFSTPIPVLGVALTFAAAAFARSAIFPALAGAESDDVRRLVAIVGWGVVVLAALARGIGLAWAVRAADGRLRGEVAVTDARTFAATGVTGLAWAIGAAVVHLTLSLWFWTGLASAGLVYVLGRAPLPLLGAAGLAGVLSVAAIAGPALGLWLEVSLARAVVRRESIARAGAEAWRTLGERPGFVVVAWLATALLAFGLASMVQTFMGMSPPQSWATAGVMVSGLLLVALIDAVATVARLDAYAALELDRAGVLPQPPRPPAAAPVLPRATLVDPASVVQARLVPPADPGVTG
jgi:hypothetical protein